ncbi:MAG: hypothetical protein IPJ65_20385 [Archangiaceae bacterium]|nr:hypothetical protein [Archangiaceae bacterium]
MWRALFAAALLAVTAVAAGACVSNAPARLARAEPLYFAVEVHQHGKRVGAPRLLGLAGKKVTAERRAPGAAEADYRLVLDPHEAGGGYQLGLHLALPSGESDAELSLLHGEERSVRLGPDTELKVLLMRVDSDEFRALMQTRESVDRGQI